MTSPEINVCKRLWKFAFAKNMNKSIGKFIGKNLRGKYSQKFLDHAKQFARDALKTTSKKVI